MNSVNLTGVIRNSAEAILGQNLVGFANLDMGASTISILSMGGRLPEDGAKVQISGQSTSHIFVTSSPRVNSDDSLSSYEVRFTDRPLQAWTIVFDCKMLSSEQHKNEEQEESGTNVSEFKPIYPMKKNAPLEGIVTGSGNEFINLDGETYYYEPWARISEEPVVGKQVRIYWNFAEDGSGEKFCHGVYAVKPDSSGKNKNSGGQTGNNGNNGSSSHSNQSKSPRLHAVKVTGKKAYGIYLDKVFYNFSKHTQGLDDSINDGDIVDAVVSSTDRTKGVKRYLQSIKLAEQQPAASNQ